MGVCCEVVHLRAFMPPGRHESAQTGYFGAVPTCGSRWRGGRPSDRLACAGLCSSMEEHLRPKELVGGSSPSRGTKMIMVINRDNEATEATMYRWWSFVVISHRCRMS